MNRSISFLSVYDRGWIPGRSKWRKKLLNFLDDMTVTVSARWLDVFWTCNVWNLCFLLLEPPSQEAGPQALTRRLLCVALHRALPSLTAGPTSQRPILLLPAASSTCHSPVKADRLNMSGDIRKSYWLLKAFFMARSYFSWPATCSQVLITFQPTAAIYSNILGPQMFVCMCLSVCVRVWIRLEGCSKAVDCKVRTKGKS